MLKRLGDQVKDELVKFDCIQVKPTTEASHYVGPDGTLRVPLIVGTDCQRGCDLPKDQSQKYVFVKMAKPSFESLKEALNFPDVRVRLQPDVPRSQPPRLLGLRLFGSRATDGTFFDDTVLGFSDNLTCLIGPRGSGKSAAIDAVRYLMGYNRGLDQIGKVSDQVRERQRATLEKTRIEALYQCADGKTYRLAATFDPHESYVTEVYDLDGNRVNIDDVETSGEFPVNLYGWGELELLAEDPVTQRELLDRFVPGATSLKDEKKRLYDQLADNTKALKRMAREMDRYFSESDLSFARLHEFKSDFDALNTAKIKTVFTQLDSVQARRSALKRVRTALDKRLRQGEIAAPINIAQMLEGDAFKDWADKLAARLMPDQLDDWMRATSSEHEKRLNVALHVVDAEDDALSRQEDAAAKKIQDAIGDDEAITGDLRNGAKQRYERASANYADYKKLHADFENLRKDRDQTTAAIGECCQRIFATRDQEIAHIRKEVSLVEDEEYQVDLVLRQQADRAPFAVALSESKLAFHGNWRAEKRTEVISEKLTPSAFVGVLMSGDGKSFVSLLKESDGKTCRVNHAERLVADNCPFAPLDDFDIPRVDAEKLGRLLELEEVVVDDEFFITLGGRAIQHCSPGQRCSAMLPVVTLTTQAPLIIDQPEDNLDNRLVSRALFKILARLKETRQIIVATHNPNILVSGDAEQVLLLGSSGDVERYGSIDDAGIVDAVISLMEGGVEAFEKRKKKYAPYLSRN